jgi:chemosensory pili system protein ChpA (sensor histidine kinase/response regulator)
MNSPPQFNALPLLTVKPGLDESLGKVSQALEQFFAGNGDSSGELQAAIDELHRLRGVLQMLSLEGLIVYCSELEKLLQEIADNVLQFTPVHQASIRRALFALTHYLDALADGAPNTALRLFNQYQEILQARGIETAFEVDLFFPELDVELPEWVQEIPLQDEAQAHIRSIRSQYQQALLKWLRNDNTADALQTMRTAVLGATGCADARQRDFWWVAGGLLDCLIYDGLPPELNARKILGRIDLQMKALADGKEQDTRPVLFEMLYLVARSHAVSDTVDEIKRIYALDDYLPEEPPLPPSEIEEVLDQVRTLLKHMEESWERCVRDEAEACKTFGEQAAELHSLSERLDRNTLQFLCKQIHNISGHTDEPERAQRVALDMAMALLLTVSGAEHYTHLGSGFQEQARILGQRMQVAIMSLPEDEQHLDQLVELHCQMEERDVMGTLATEMQNNLQHVEQGLNAFFENFDKRGELTQLVRLLGQVQGGMRILSLDVAGQLVAVLKQTVEHYAEGSNPSPVEMRSIATAISAMDSYVQDLSHGHRPDSAPLESVLQNVQSTQQPAEAQAPQAGQAAPVAAPAISEEDNELLEVFLEEAQEVLEILRANLEISQLHPDSMEPITVMRRGFHTLKGSGRMVGLDDLGEVAWAVERAMNNWLKDNKPATPALLKFIAKAADQFQGWVQALSSTGSAQVDGTELVELAQQFENGVEPLSLLQPEVEIPSEESVAEPQAEPEPAEVEPEAVPVPAAKVEEAEPEVELEPSETDTVVVGAVSLSTSLFSIATEEAAGHLAALRQHLETLRESTPPVISHDFMRAAHTLAGVNRTMGFQMVADLAYALEQWLEIRIENPFVLSDAQNELVGQVINTLDEMSRQIREERREPQAQPELIARLQAEREQLGSAELQVAPAEAEQSEEQAETVVPPPAETAPPEVAPAAAPAVPAQEPAGEQTPRMRQMVDERRVRDDIDEQLLPIFLEESEDLYPQVGTDLRGWRDQPDNESLPNNLQRLLHTLKGSARMAGVMRLGELTHRMEDRVIAAMAKAERDPGLFDELDNYFDRIGNVLEQLRSGEVAQEPEAELVPAEAVAAAPMLELGAERAIFAAMLRVRSDTIDHLVNEAGEISVARSRIETELRNFRNGLLDLTDSINRLRHQLREIEIQAESQMEARGILSTDLAEKFDPLEFDRFTRFQELTRFMGESVHDVQTVQQTLLKNLDETAAALSAQAYLNRDLQQSLMVIRMVPFSSISERLYRIVRQTSKELDKRANLDLVGVEVELDRSVLERMAAPFEHLLRNAVAHGLESQERRAEQGKPPIGEIRVALSQESNEVVFDFSDDGGGLDMENLRQRAVAQGLVEADEQLNEEQTMQLIFSSGLSTASEVTEISGRGIGMDVVRSEITALGGRIDVSSEAGKGTHFRIHLPLTLAVTQVLMVQSGQDTYAVPSVMVEQVLQLKPAMLEDAYQQGSIEWHGRNYPLRYLAHLLGDSERPLESQLHNPVLLLRSGEQRIALHVDSLQGNQEAVVKNIGPQLARLTGIAGATVLGSGRVVLILNPVMLKQRIPVAVKEMKAKAVPEAEELNLRPLVMVVDDSLTVRKITSRMLTRAGYEVITAKDGVDALEQLTQATPAVILLDVEMPRMDGFEFTKHVRSDSKIKHLPIIMITSRTADKHRNYAMELGVNAYFGKPYQEEELLAEIAGYIGAPEIG